MCACVIYSTHAHPGFSRGNPLQNFCVLVWVLVYMMPFDLDGVGSIGGFAIIISIGLLSCLFIFLYQRSVRQLLVNKKKVWELPPRPKHYVQPRRSLVDKIRSMFAQLQDLANSVTVVYLEGPPGFGKTQLACQYAEDFYRHHVSFVQGTILA